MTVFSLVIVIVLVLVALAYASRKKTSREERLCTLFGLESDNHELLGSDLGGAKDKIFLRGDGVVGVPDALFRRREDRSIVVGEAKKRRFNGNVTDYERFQVVLYLGLAQRKFRQQASAVLRYGCGTCVPIEPDPECYRWLISTIPAYRKVAREIGLS
jgi:hypothetical protein